MTHPTSAPGSNRSPELAASSEIEYLLRRAGIALEADRLSLVAREWASLQEHLALVNQNHAATDEPAPVFDARPKAGSE